MRIAPGKTGRAPVQAVTLLETVIAAAVGSVVLAALLTGSALAAAQLRRGRSLRDGAGQPAPGAGLHRA